jgi:flagellar basal-body rod modification protein FlgD
MAIAPIESVYTSTSTNSTTNNSADLDPGTADAATSASTLDRDAFLKLLVAQLKYQDPSKPVDASEMISQSASLSVVDKLDQISTLLTDGGATNRLTLGGSIIGKQITFAGPDGFPVTQVVSAVAFDGSTMILRAGEWEVPLDAVRAITAVPAPVAPPAAPPAGSSSTT